MKKGFSLNIPALVFAVFLLLCAVTGCGKKELEKTGKINSEGAWSVEQISLTNDSFYLPSGISETDFNPAGDTLHPVYADNHFYYAVYPRQGAAAEIQGIDLEHPEEFVTYMSFPVEEGKETKISYLQYNEDKSLTYLKTVSPAIDTGDSDMSVEETMEASIKALESVVTLETVSLDKKEITASVDVSDALSSFAIYSCVSDGQENLYVRGAFMYPSDSGYIDSDSQLVILNMKSGEAEKIDNWQYYNNMTASGNKEVFDIIESGDKIIFRRWDNEKKEFSSDNKVACDRFASYGFFGCYAGTGDTILYADSENVYQCDVKSKETKVLLNLNDCDIAGDESLLVSAVDEDTLYIFSRRNNYNGFDIDFFSLTAAKPSDLPEKTEFILSCRLADNYIRQLAADFNRANEEYRIKIEEISEPPKAVFLDDLEASEPVSYNDVFFDTVASGTAGDLILLSDLHESINYAELFEDIYPYIESDDELSSRNLNTNLLRLYEQDGKLITLPAVCWLNILACHSRLLEESPLTIDKFLEVISENPDKTILDGVPQDEILNRLFYNNIEYFIDFKEKKCRFTDGVFEKILLAADSFPDYEEMGSNTYISYASLILQGTQLFYNSSLFDCRAYQILKALFGEDGRITGYPGIDGEKIPAAADNVLLAINKNSNYKEACFEFMKYVFEYRIREENSSSFPIDNDILKEKISKQIKNTKNEELDMHDKTTLELQALSRQEEEKLFELANSVNVIDWDYIYSIRGVSQIFSKETQSFFDGNKTASETCEALQSKISDSLQKENK